jgi:hypothetical protein
MNPHLRGCLLLVFILLLGDSALAAADLNPRFMLSIGGSFLPDKDVRDSSGTAHPAVLNGNLQGGILAAINVHAPLALEAGFRISHGELQSRDGSFAAPGHSVGFSAHQVFGNVVYSTPYSDGGLRLFVSGGAGFRRIHVKTAPGADWGWSLNFGGGLEARISRRVSIRAEARDFVGAMPRFVPAQSPNGFLHDIQTSVGLILHLQ